VFQIKFYLQGLVNKLILKIQNTAERRTLNAKSEYRIQLKAEGTRRIQNTAERRTLNAQREYRIQLKAEGTRLKANTEYS
jgi:hypothetical protein